MPPECFIATKLAGAAPRPAIKTPRERAPQLDEVMCMIIGVSSAGIMSA
jgi:hypothetical protein